MDKYTSEKKIWRSYNNFLSLFSRAATFDIRNEHNVSVWIDIILITVQQQTVIASVVAIEHHFHNFSVAYLTMEKVGSAKWARQRTCNDDALIN